MLLNDYYVCDACGGKAPALSSDSALLSASKYLNANYLRLLRCWLNNNSATFSKIFAGTLVAPSEIEAWWAAVAGKGPTVSIIKTKDNAIIGGYYK